MPAEELYDLEQDPYEIRNLAGSDEPSTGRPWSGCPELERWIDESNDQGLTPEPPQVAAAKGATRPETKAAAKRKARAKAQ